MRLSKAWIVASKDFKTFTKRKSILYTIIYFELVVSIGLPFLIRFVASRPNTAIAHRRRDCGRSVTTLISACPGISIAAFFIGIAVFLHR